jgi:hypothetical protein
MPSVRRPKAPGRGRSTTDPQSRSKSELYLYFYVQTIAFNPQLAEIIIYGTPAPLALKEIS